MGRLIVLSINLLCSSKEGPISAALLVSQLNKIFVFKLSFDHSKLLDMLHEFLAYHFLFFGQSISGEALAGLLEGLQLIQNIIFRNVCMF